MKQRHVSNYTRLRTPIAKVVLILGLNLMAGCSLGTKSAIPESVPVVTILPSTQTLIPISTPSLAPTVPPVQTPSPSNTFTPTITATPHIGSTQVSEKDGVMMVAIPGGEFLMGSASSDRDAFTEEKPQHIVSLDFFWMDRTEVTNAMYALCVKEGGCQLPSSTRSFLRDSYYGNPEFSKYPVIYVSWREAAAYCKWANKRLPTEAEWEKAARSVDGRIFPWGNVVPDLNSNLLNYDRQLLDTNEVGKYFEGASPYGVLDMAGNVWEWVADWYDGKYYATSPTRNPQGPTTGTNRILRGGSWVDGVRGVRTAFRSWFTPDLGDGNVGFRCVR